MESKNGINVVIYISLYKCSKFGQIYKLIHNNELD